MGVEASDAGTPQVVQRPLRLPSGEEHALLLLAGWSTTDTRGLYERSGRRVWWQRVTAGGASE